MRRSDHIGLRNPVIQKSFFSSREKGCNSIVAGGLPQADANARSDSEISPLLVTGRSDGLLGSAGRDCLRQLEVETRTKEKSPEMATRTKD